MGSTLRKLLFVSAPIVLASVLFLEFGLFRYFVVVDNTPLATYDSDAQILKYLPDQTGIRYPDRDRRHPVAYSINHDGWNSAHAAYESGRTSKRRIAVVGDSFVEALQVTPAQSVSSRLEAALGPATTDVYGFGISGAPLSQYLHMARYVARAYHPDQFVVVLVHNDYIESYRPKVERYSTSFMHVDLGDTVREVPPAPYERQAAAQWLLARSATLRFVFYAWRALADAPAAPSASDSSARYEANINVAELDAEEPRIRRAAGYLFDQFAELSRSTNIPVMFAMDAAREAIYVGKDPRSLEVSRLNRIAREEAARVGLPFVDLTDAFVNDYAVHHTRFEFATDNHWNAGGHDVVAREIARSLSAAARPAPSTR